MVFPLHLDNSRVVNVPQRGEKWRLFDLWVLSMDRTSFKVKSKGYPKIKSICLCNLLRKNQLFGSGVM